MSGSALKKKKPKGKLIDRYNFNEIYSIHEKNSLHSITHQVRRSTFAHARLVLEVLRNKRDGMLQRLEGALGRKLICCLEQPCV